MLVYWLNITINLVHFKRDVEIKQKKTRRKNVDNRKNLKTELKNKK